MVFCFRIILPFSMAIQFITCVAFSTSIHPFLKLEQTGFIYRMSPCSVDRDQLKIPDQFSGFSVIGRPVNVVDDKYLWIDETTTIEFHGAMVCMSVDKKSSCSNMTSFTPTGIVHIKEIVLFDRILDDVEISAIEKILQSYWTFRRCYKPVPEHLSSPMMNFSFEVVEMLFKDEIHEDVTELIGFKIFIVGMGLMLVATSIKIILSILI